MAFRIIAGFTVLAAAGSVGNGQLLIEWVPVSADAPPEQNPTPDGWRISGNQITMREGGRLIWLELRIGDWDPNDTGVQLKVYRVNIDASSYESGAQGRVELAVGVDCTNDSVCEEAFGSASYCPKAAGPWWPNRCVYGFIDSGRSDFVFVGVDSLQDADPHGGMHFVSMVLSDPADDPEPFPPEGLYAGTLALYVTPNAQGTFTFAMESPPGSSLIDQNDQFIPSLDLVPARITVATGQCCYDLDVNKYCVGNVIAEECNALPAPHAFTLGEECSGGLDPCGCLAASAPRLAQCCADGGSGGGVRYLSFSPGDLGHTQAIRVTLKDLPPPYDVFNAMTMWVGAPREVSEKSGNVDPSSAPGWPTFTAATLQCEPYFRDWSAFATVHVYHEGIVPGGTYALQMIDALCGPDVAEAFSTGLELRTSAWGDVLKDCTTRPCGPPDGSVDVATDVLAVLEKFVNRGGPIKARADIEPACVDLTINITDVMWILEAFRGLPYPFVSDGDLCDGTYFGVPCG